LTFFKTALLHALTLLIIATSTISEGFPQSGGSSTATGATDALPAWAFLWDPTVQVPPPSEAPVTLAGSNVTYSWKQARDLFVALDWHPEAHPAMPDIVANGRKPEIRACGACHRVEGTGGPENASLAGLPVAYFVQQIADFKSGARVMSGPLRPSTQFMSASVKGLTDADIRAAAEYFAGLTRKSLIKVVESDTIPKTGPSRLFYVRSPDGGTEPLGRRIVEMPDVVDQFELRDSRATFTAFVPVGSLSKGEALARTGGSGATVACNLCHGADLKGLDAVPGIAGRSPTYLMRQLYEFQHGSRSGTSSALMRPTVEKLSQDDMIALAAYVASLDP
jgi:cytochrome c553